MSIFDLFKKKSVNVETKKLSNKTLNKPKKKELRYFYDISERCLYKYDIGIEELAQFYNDNITLKCSL